MNIKIDKQRNNPLIKAYKDLDIDKFRQLIEDGANVNCLSNTGHSLINLVVQEVESPINRKFFLILMKNNVHLEPIGKSGNLLYTALVYRREFFFKELILQEINIDAKNKNSFSDRTREHIIFESMKTGDYYFMDLILNKKLITEFPGKYIDTALTAFIRLYEKNFTKKESVDILQRFIALGEDTNERGDNGMTPIHCAVKYKADHLLDVLLEDSCGTQLNSRDILGNTALIYAVLEDNFDMAKKLIEKGAALNILNGDEESALFLSMVHRCGKIFNLLLDNNAHLLDIDKKGNNILHNMIYHEWAGYTISINWYEKIITRYPELVFAKNKHGETPIDSLTIGNTSHHNKKFINSLVEKIDKSKFKNNKGMSL